MSPHKHEQSNLLDPYFKNGDPYFDDPQLSSPIEKRSLYMLICGCVAILFATFCLGSLITWSNAVFFGGLGSFLMVILALGLMRRLEHKWARQDELWEDFPTVMPAPSSDSSIKVRYLIPTPETDQASRSLVLIATTPCSMLKGVSEAVISSSLRPIGITYYRSSFQANQEGMAILCLRLPKENLLDVAYNKKLRLLLLHGARRSLDIKLKYEDGRELELKKIAVYKSA